MGRPIRRPAAPEFRGQTLGGDHLVGRGQQQGEDGPFPAPADRHDPPGVDHFHRAKDAELHARFALLRLPAPPVTVTLRTTRRPECRTRDTRTVTDFALARAYVPAGPPVGGR